MFLFLPIELSVSFEKTVYTVMEGDGEVEICLVLNSTATVDVFVIISVKQDGDAYCNSYNVGEVSQ